MVRCVSRSIARHWQVPDVVLVPHLRTRGHASGLFWYPRSVRRSVVAPLGLLLPLTACRFGFEERPADAGPDAAPVLPCGAPTQFKIPVPTAVAPGFNTVTLTAIAATATATGYDMLAVDSAGDVQGFAFGFDGPQLAQRASGALVFSGATGVVAAVDTPDGILAAIEYGRPDPAGTALVPLDAQLAPRGAQQMNAAWTSMDNALARTTDGALAFLGGQTSEAVAAKQVSASGTDLGASHLVIGASESARVPTIAPAGTGFVVTWTSTPPSPNEVRAEVLDAQLSVIVPPTTINPGARFDGDNPRGGYAPSADLYLFAWSFKTSTTDELWVSLRDRQLTELRAFQLSPHGVLPRIVAGKDDFLVAWKDTNTTSGIAAARVRFDGSVTSLVVAGNGGKTLGWDLATRAGQPVLIWIESATTPGLWLDPLCN